MKLSDIVIPEGVSAVFVDPGTGGTGLARWHEWGQSVVPDEVQYFVPTGERWFNRFMDLMDSWTIYLRNRSVNVVVIEGTELWGRSAKSQASAISGDLLKLAYSTGALLATGITCYRRGYLVPATAWKGQLPKRVVQARIRRTLGRELGRACPDEYLQDHVSDAVGMGLAAMGLL